MAEDEISAKSRQKSGNCISSIFSIYLESLKIIFLQNPKLFIKIYTFTTLPLSLLLTAFSVSSTPRFLKSHINRLEWLYHAVPIWVEAANIQDESRADFRKLLWVRFFYGVPILAFSLSALVTVVVLAYVSCRNTKKKLNLRAATTALKLRWAPPVLTCMVNFIVWVGWSHLDPFFNRIALNYHPYFTAVQVVVEVYLMTVLSLALVVSVIEGRVGFGAIWVGWGLMRGKRVCGLVLTGLILLVSGFIGKEMIAVMDGGDFGGYTWAVWMSAGCMVGLVVLLGWFILWSNVIFAVFYFDCRKRNVIREDEQIDFIDDYDI